MTEQTARFALPLIDPGQSQKEMTHNEALATLDAALQPAVNGVGLATPPASPAPGDQWIVGSAPTDAWTGHAGAIAAWTTSGWRFVAPAEGISAWSIPDALPLRYAGGAWIMGDISASRLLIGGIPVVGAQRAAIAAPAGGSTTDAEARTAIEAILDALKGHGLIAKS